MVDHYPKLFRPLARTAAVLLLLIAGVAAYQWSVHDHRRREQSAALRLDNELSATVEVLDDDIATDLGLAPETRGLVITSLADGRTAARSGLRLGDVIQRIDSHAIIDLKSAVDALADDPGRRVQLVVLRHGREIELGLIRD